MILISIMTTIEDYASQEEEFLIPDPAPLLFFLLNFPYLNKSKSFT